MKYCLYTDVHFSEYSSIVRSLGENYSTRLETLIKSISWAEQQAIENRCDEIICLGDFFDRPDLNSRELTALKEIKWAKLPHTFIVGNHEASVKSLKYNSVMALKNNGFTIIDEPTYRYNYDKSNFLFIPYLLDEDRKTLAEYTQGKDISNLYVFSHNDVKGIQYGAFESKIGFEVSDIENNCRLFLNGHLHNGTKFCKNGINLGNLCGQNFSEDATQYEHDVMILDTVEHSLFPIENPFAFNFYKLSYTNVLDASAFKQLKGNAVISIKCAADLKNSLNELLNYPNIKNKIVETRITIAQESVGEITTDLSDLTVDHLAKFAEFCKEKITNSEILSYELSEVCK